MKFYKFDMYNPCCCKVGSVTFYASSESEAWALAELELNQKDVFYIELDSVYEYPFDEE